MTVKNIERVGVAIPQTFIDGPVDMSLVRDFVARADSLGYHSGWVQDSIIGNVPFLEAVSLMCYAAGVSERIRLAVAVIITLQRNPVHMAKAFATLDNMSAGRAILGVGLGHRGPNDGLFGIPEEWNVRYFTEGVRVMKALWTQEKATFDGRYWPLDGVSIAPRPVQKPHVPIWFGGLHPNALRRAVRHGDAWIGGGSSSTADFAGAAQTVRQALEDHGRDPASFPISKRVYIAVDGDEARAERRLRDWFVTYDGNADMASRVCVWGSVDRCIEGIQEVILAGADMVLLNQTFDDMEHLDRFTEEIVPRLEW